MNFRETPGKIGRVGMSGNDNIKPELETLIPRNEVL